MSKQQLFSIIHASALSDRRLQSVDITVLCAIGTQIGPCDLSATELASLLGKDPKAIRQSLKRLLRTDYIKQFGRSRRPGRRRNALYKLNENPSPDSKYLRGQVSLVNVA